MVTQQDAIFNNNRYDLNSFDFLLWRWIILLIIFSLSFFIVKNYIIQFTLLICLLVYLWILLVARSRHYCIFIDRDEIWFPSRFRMNRFVKLKIADLVISEKEQYKLKKINFSDSSESITFNSKELTNDFVVCIKKFSDSKL